MKLYHKYRTVARFYHDLNILSLRYPDPQAYINGKTITHAKFTPESNLNTILNTLKGMIDFSLRIPISKSPVKFQTK